MDLYGLGAAPAQGSAWGQLPPLGAHAVPLSVDLA